MPTYKDEAFPFEEIKKENGDYFSTVEEAQAAGFELSQIWSVIADDNVFTYGPTGHIINLIGYIATKETHDGETYYTEDVSDSFEQDA